MNYTSDKSEGMGRGGEQGHIWLRYATQFNSGGRTHTIEMGIPVPLGASAEQRAQLIREAEAGMEQLASHIERRVSAMQQRNQRPQSTISPATPAPASRPAAELRDETQKTPVQSKEPVVPPTRPHVGAQMPATPKLPGDANGNLTPTQFLQIIKANWGLTSQQAKEMLQVQSLNGLNFREALERLQARFAQKGSELAQKGPETAENKSAAKPASPPTSAPSAPSLQTAVATRPAPNPAPAPSPKPPAPITPPVTPITPVKPPINLATTSTVNEKRLEYRFDEEDEDDEEEIILTDLDGDDYDLPGLSAEERLRARDIIDKLKDVRGSTAANPARLNVLNNVLGDQISPAQLQQLLQALWGVTTSKKLKADQVEELIYWAKKDEFIEEVEAVLAVLEEE